MNLEVSNEDWLSPLSVCKVGVLETKEGRFMIFVIKKGALHKAVPRILEGTMPHSFNSEHDVRI